MKENNNQIKHFTVSMMGEQMSTSGNMTLNDVANALITLAYSQGLQDGKKDGAEKQTAPSE